MRNTGSRPDQMDEAQSMKTVMTFKDLHEMADAKCEGDPTDQHELRRRTAPGIEDAPVVAPELAAEPAREETKSLAEGKSRWESIRNKLKLLTFNKVMCTCRSGWLQRAQTGGWFSSWQWVWVVVHQTQIRWFSDPEDRDPLGILDFQLVACEVECLWESAFFSQTEPMACSQSEPGPGLPLAPISDNVKRQYCYGCNVPNSWGLATWIQGNPAIFRVCPLNDDYALEFRAESEHDGEKWIKALAANIRAAEEQSGPSEARRQAVRSRSARSQVAGSDGGDERQTDKATASRWWQVTQIDLKKFEQIARTGDILLFRSPGNMPMLIRTASGGCYDHVALILKLSGGTIALLESTGVQGVGLVTWEEFVARKWHLIYDELALRRVSFERTDVLITALQQWAISVLGKPYGITVGKLMERKSISAGGAKQDGTFFCSELVAEALKVLKVIPRGTASSQFWPSTFESSQSMSIEMLPGCSFDEELVLQYQEEKAGQGPADGRDVTISVF